MTENKVKFGLKNFHFAPISGIEDGKITYGAVMAMPGSVSLTLKHDGDVNEFEADDTVYYDQNVDNGYKGDLELARILDAFRTSCLGETLGDKNGIMAENANAEIKGFACMYEIMGDVNKTRYVAYNCLASRPDADYETKGQKGGVKTDKLSFSARPRPDGWVQAHSTSATPASIFDAWYTKVVEPDEAVPKSSGTTTTPGN